MGGLGSGRQSGSGRGTVGSCRALDINLLNKAGYIGTRCSGSWQWLRDGERVAWIRVFGEVERLKLVYRSRRAGEEWVDVIEYVEIAQVPCHLGGFRPYFICPGIEGGVACRRRAVKIHGSGRYFLCRNCCRLAYGSQSENATDRTIRRADKLRMALGGEPGLEQPLPLRPKGMWRRTYDRRAAAIMAADEEAEAAFLSEACYRFGRIGELPFGFRRT